MKKLAEFLLMIGIIFSMGACDNSEPPEEMITPPPVSTNKTIISVPSDYSTIQEAIDNAVSGDTILVSPGTYNESLRVSLSNILITSLFLEDQDVSYISTTILQGNENAVVSFSSSTTANTILQGLTITGGKGTTYTRPNGVVARGGGGVQGLNASPTIRFNIIEDNEAVMTGSNAYAGGGGIRFEGGTPTITNNIIRNNRGNFGGGVFLDQTSAVVTNNIISNNEALLTDFAGGGGLYLDYAGGQGNKIINNTIINNKSAGQGGGFILAGNTVYQNLEFQNNIVYNNENLNVMARNGASLSDFAPMYSFIEGGSNTGEAILDGDPGLKNNITFELNENSQCIDAGNPGVDYNDYQGTDSPSLGAERNDIGAYGGPLARNF